MKGLTFKLYDLAKSLGIYNNQNFIANATFIERLARE